MLNSFLKGNKLKWNRSTVGILTFVLTLICNALFSLFPQLYMAIYWKGIFQVIRIVHDFTLGLLPIPSLYLIVPSFFLYFFYKRFKSWKSIGLALFNSLIWIINLFYLLWGFNYTQPSIYELTNLNPVEIDSIHIQKEFISQTKVIEELALIEEQNHENLSLESNLRILQEELIATWNIPTIGKVRIRALPAGSLLCNRTSGIYIPHAIEGHYDSGLYYKQHPFTMAHEMAHGYGFTDESVCNYIAYLTCLKSESQAIRYSAELAYWRYLASYYNYYYPENYKELKEQLNPIVKNDLEEIKKHIEKYKDLMPVMRDIIYDKYLKTHGIKSGIKSYNEMIMLIAAYKAQNSN